MIAGGWGGCVTGLGEVGVTTKEVICPKIDNDDG